MPETNGNPIKAAVLGLGRSGWNIHVAALRNDSRFEVVSVLDADENRRRQAEEELGCDSYTDFGKLLKKSPAELVVVATPTVLHASQAIRAMNSGRHVVVEKPMSSTLNQADRMIRAAAEKGVHLFIHQNYRFSGIFTLFKEILKSGKLGALTHVGYCYHVYNRRNDWQCLRKFSGGQLNNKITHPLDQALALVNSPAKDILCDMKHISDAGDVEDHVKLLLRTESGVTIDMEDLTSAATVQQAPEWTLLGTSGALTLSKGVARIKFYDPKQAPRIQVCSTPLVEGRKYGNADKLPWKEEQFELDGKSRRGFYDALYSTLKRHKKFPIDPGQVREMMRILGVCRKQNPNFPGK